MLHSSLMRFRWSVLLLCKYLTAVCACLLPEQTAVGLTDHLPSDGGQHFSIFKALILNFTVSVLHFSKSDHVHSTDKCENAVYIWKFMSTLASCPSTLKFVKQHQSCAFRHQELDRSGQITAASQTFTSCSGWSHILCFTQTYSLVMLYINRNLRAGIQMLCPPRWE